MQANERQLPIHVPMTQFPFSNRELVVGGMPLTQLAARVGQTPFYAYDRNLLAQRVAHLRSALPASIKLHYAMKANPMPALVCHMAGFVDGLDVASGGELKIALDSGVNPDKISFAGPGKSHDELKQATAAGILIFMTRFPRRRGNNPGLRPRRRRWSAAPAHGCCRCRWADRRRCRSAL